jgi:hypothetical protein
MEKAAATSNRFIRDKEPIRANPENWTMKPSL